MIRYLFSLIIFSVWSELYAVQDNHTFYYYTNRSSPIHTRSTSGVSPYLLQGAHDNYAQACYQVTLEEHQRQIVAHNPYLNYKFQKKKQRIDAEIVSIQQLLDHFISSEMNQVRKLELLLVFFNYVVSEPELQQFLYNTQKKLAKYFVDSKGVIKKCSSKDFKKIKKVSRKFYKELKRYRDKSDAIIASQLLSAASSGSFDQCLSQKGSAFAAQLRTNRTNADLYAVLELVRNNEFDKAASIVNRYRNNERQQAQDLYQYYFYQVYNEYGINRQFSNNPEYGSHHFKKTSLPTPNHEYNSYLSERAQEKIRIEETVFDICKGEAPIAVPATIIEHRLKALEEFKRNGDVRSLSTISLSDDAKRFLEEYGINASALEMMEANALQKRAQHEFVLITEKMALADGRYKEYTNHVSIVNAQLIDIGVSCAQENNIAHAFIISDCCTHILTDLEQWSESLPYTLKRTLVYCAAIVQGVGDGVINSVAYAYHHPIEAVLTAALPEIMVPYHVAKITCSALTITYSRLSRINYKTVTKDSIKEKFDQLYELACTLDGPELVRHATAFGTQILIDGKVSYACNAASKKAIRLLAEELNAVKNTRSLSPLFALAGDARSPKIILCAEEEASSLQKFSHESNAFNKGKDHRDIPGGKSGGGKPAVKEIKTGIKLDENAITILDKINKEIGRDGIITNKIAKEAAKALGFDKIGETSKTGALIFRKGNKYISPDSHRHNGGFWKMANSVDEIMTKPGRLGTYDIFLNKVGN